MRWSIIIIIVIIIIIIIIIINSFKWNPRQNNDAPMIINALTTIFKMASTSLLDIKISTE